MSKACVTGCVSFPRQKVVIMSNIYDEFELDLDAKNVTGTWVEIREGIRIKTRHLGCPESKKLLKRLRAPYEKKGRNALKLTEEISTKIAVQAICRTAIQDWEGFTDRKGKILKFSVDAALEILRDPAMEALTNEVIFCVTELEVFNKKELEDAEKTLKKSSAGGSNGVAKNSKK